MRENSRKGDRTRDREANYRISCPIAKELGTVEGSTPSRTKKKLKIEKKPVM
jgi:hypothetical protein